MRTFLTLILSFLFVAPVHAIGMPNGRPITCPKELRTTGTLLIGLGSRHGGEMAILRKSDGVRFVLVSKDKTLIMPSEDFQKTVLFQLDVDAEVETADGGMQTIFNAPGEYQVIVANDAMTEKGGLRCTFRFTGGL